MAQTRAAQDDEDGYVRKGKDSEYFAAEDQAVGTGESWQTSLE
jgi:hypothetical protein